jgi:hypothetical protein
VVDIVARETMVVVDAMAVGALLALHRVQNVEQMLLETRVVDVGQCPSPQLPDHQKGQLIVV